MNCLLALTHFKSMFYFYTPWKYKTHRFFDVFKKYGNGTLGWKWLVKVKLNDFMNGYLSLSAVI